MSELKNRIVVITGAAGGFGQAVTMQLATQGARLALADIDVAGLDELAAKTKASGAEVIAKITDVTDEASTASFFAEVNQAYGGAEALISLPGMSIAAKVAEMPIDAYERVIDLNLKSLFLSTKHFIPLVDTERGAQLLLISSMAATRANPNAPLYCAAKAAVSMLGQGLALQLMQQNIRVTAVKPGPVDTQGFWGDRPVPRDKFMRPDDVASVIDFILKLPKHVVMHEAAFESFEFFKK